MLSPVARGLIVGVLFCGWIAYSVMYTQDFDVFSEAGDKSESSLDIFNIENSERITSNLNTPFKERSDRILFSRKGKGIKSYFNQLLFIIFKILDLLR